MDRNRGVNRKVKGRTHYASLSRSHYLDPRGQFHNDF